MISIIICSIDIVRLNFIRRNIEETIGVPYELLAIDNSINPKGITSVYNEGVAKAKFENLLFVHEDVKFSTLNWGAKLIDILSDSKIGLVGIAGCAYKAKFPTSWMSHGMEEKLIKINIVQHYKHHKKEPLHAFQRCGNEDKARVACVDGLFLATKKSVIEQFPFDENLKGFHGYDIDIALAINQKYHVYVTFDILIEHFSEGTLSKEWIDSTFYLNEKWASQLPCNPTGISKKEMAICEKHTFRAISKFLSNHVSIEKLYLVLKKSALKDLDYATYLKMHISLVKVYLFKKDSKMKNNALDF